MIKRGITFCPRCRGSLSTSVSGKLLDCAQCAAAYPLLVGEMPILVPSPETYLASQVLGMSRAVVSTLREIKRLERLANKHPERSEELLEWRAALRTNVELLEEVRDEILPHCTGSAICEVAASNSNPLPEDALHEIGQALALARRDWGGEKACEKEIKILVDAVAKQIDDSCEDPKRVLVLGSGMGRMAEELGRRYEYTCAIELLLAMELLRRKLHQQPVSFNMLEPRNRRFGTDIIKKVEIRSRGGGNGSLCHFVVGDVRHAPWPDGFFSCVVSAYFSDVVPYSALFPEMTRLLRPNGILVHVGPLAYHHQEIGEHLAADQLAKRLVDFGYVVVQTDWVRTTLREDPTSMYSHICDNLVLTARKLVHLRLEPPELGMDAVLGLREGVTLSTEVKICNESATVLKSVLRKDGEKAIQLSPLATKVVEEIDGRTRLGDIFTKVGSRLGTERLPRGELDKLKQVLIQLVELGALGLGPRR